MPINIQKNTKAYREAGKRDYTPSNIVTVRPFSRENAANATKFTGKRYLGKDANGREIWVNFEMTREDTNKSVPKIRVWYTANTDLLFEEGAELSNRRISFGTGTEQRYEVRTLLQSKDKPYGAVTKRTIEYIEDIVHKANLDNPKRHDAYLIANAIYVGTVEDCKLYKNRFTIQDMLATWNFRENYS